MYLKRFVIAIVAGLVLLGAGAMIASAQDNRTVHWERWDSEITLRENGDLRIVETHVVNFTRGPFRFGFLTRDMGRLTGIRDVDVSEDGVPLNEVLANAETPGTFFTTIDDGTYEIYYFLTDPPVDNEIRTIEIAYTVSGAVRYYEGGDQIWWEAVGALGWPVYDATVRVILPASITGEAVGPVACYGPPCSANVKEDVVIFTLDQGTNGNTPMEIRVQFPHGIISGEAPAWQAAFDREQALGPVLNLIFVVLGILLGIGGPVGIVVIWQTRGRDPEIGPVPEHLSEPPSNLAPAIAGTLVDEKADTPEVMGTLVDLARRGYLIMEEREKPGGLFGSRSVDFTFERTDKAWQGLKPFERQLLEGVFRGRQRRDMEDLKEKFYTTIPKIKRHLYQETVSAGFFAQNPENVRGAWMALGMVMFGVGIAGAIFLPGMLGDAFISAIFPAIGLFIAGVAAMIAGSFMPAKTREGARQAALWTAFRTYLYRVEDLADLEKAGEQFDRYLPYAVAFGVDKRWIKAFSRVKTTPMPVWYHPVGYHRPHVGFGAPGGGDRGVGLADQAASPAGGLQAASAGAALGLSSMSDNLTNMLNSAADTFTSAPSSSGGSSGGFSGGGGSFGGSSGSAGGGFG